ncbi:rod shape-determining protein [Clostridium facile]|uniref:Cell shape-determining protein MreB n=1 Tax=Clostridium facile TaxID=2763035 RepID=A0ABR7IN57_9CLOT|nr:rod shape-determining protein [Clostridium facile]MBC5786570.1 rod shape-determining protein [Clostridium facile]
MATCDIGIDLGTSSVIIAINGKIVLDEPAVVAVNMDTDELKAVGRYAFDMIGRTPENIIATHPIVNGVISDYRLNEIMIQEFLKKVSNAMLMKPRVVISVHSLITDVERRAVVDAAVAAGARQVHLIDEPIAAALGAGIDISQPNGWMIVDIGGGTTDAAVISLNGIVKSESIKTGGSNMDEGIIKYILMKHKLHIGQRMAEQIKIEIGTALDPQPGISATVKGRNAYNGLPQMVTVTQEEIYEAIHDNLDRIVQAVKDVLEQTPPELIGDVHTNGIILAGGGALMANMSELLEAETGIHTSLAEEPLECVAKGTTMAFKMMDEFQDGFVTAVTHKH